MTNSKAHGRNQSQHITSAQSIEYECQTRRKCQQEYHIPICQTEIVQHPTKKVECYADNRCHNASTAVIFPDKEADYYNKQYLQYKTYGIKHWCCRFYPQHIIWCRYGQPNNCGNHCYKEQNQAPQIETKPVVLQHFFLFLGFVSGKSTQVAFTSAER